MSGSRSPCDSGHKFSSSSPPLPSVLQVCSEREGILSHVTPDRDPRRPPEVTRCHGRRRSITAPARRLCDAVHQTPEAPLFCSPSISVISGEISGKFSLKEEKKKIQQWIFISDGLKGNKCVSLSLKGTNIRWYR